MTQQAPTPHTQQPINKRPKMTQGVIAFLVLLAATLIIGAFYITTGGPQPVPSAPSNGGTWTVTHTFSGNGLQQTDVFTVSSDWQLQWTCDLSSVSESYMGVTLYSSDAALTGVAINTICKADNTSGSTEMHQGGSLYLQINSTVAWTITIQEVQ